MTRLTTAFVLTTLVLFLSSTVKGQNVVSIPKLNIPVGHLKKVNAIDFSPDNKYIATASDDNTVILWDAATGTELKSVTLPQSVKGVVFCPDSTNLILSVFSRKATFGRAAFYIWNTRSDRQADSLPFFGEPKCTLSADGRYLLVRGLLEKSKNTLDSNGLNAMDAASLGKGTLPETDCSVWDLNENLRVYDHFGNLEQAGIISINKKNYLVTAGIKPVDYKKLGRQSDSIGRQQDSVIKAMANTPDTSVVLKAALANLKRLQTDPNGIPKNPDLRDSLMYYMSVITQERTNKLMPIVMASRQQAVQAEINAFKPDPVIEVWDCSDKTAPPGKILHPGYIVHALATSPAGDLIATAGKKGELELWDLPKGLVVRRFPNLGTTADVVQFSADGKFLLTAGAQDKMERTTIWNVKDGSKLSKDGQPYKGYSKVIAFSPNGHFFATAGDEVIHDGNVVMLYTASGKLIRKLERHANPVVHFYFSKDGRYVYTDNSYLALPENQRRQDHEDMEKILDKIRDPRNTRTGNAMRHYRDSVMVEVNQQLIKEFKERNGKKNFRIWDLTTGRVINYSPQGVAFTTDTVSPDKQYFLTSIVKKTFWSDLTRKHTDSTPAGYDPTKEPSVGEKVSTIIDHDLAIETKNLPFSLTEEMLDPNSEINRTFSQETFLIRSGSKDTVSLISLDSSDWLMVNRQGYYMCSRNSAGKLRYELNNKIYYFDQFDLQYNRPDKVIESIGLASKSTIDAYKKAYRERVCDMGFNPDSLEIQAGLNAPEIEVAGIQNIYDASASRNFPLKVEARDKKYPIRTIQVFVNGVPVNGRKGYDVGDQNLTDVTKQVSVQLSAGKNSVEVSAINSMGVGSLTARFEVEYTGSLGRP